MTQKIDTNKVIGEAIDILENPAEKIANAMKKVSKRTQNKILKELIEAVKTKKNEQKACERVKNRLISLIP